MLRARRAAALLLRRGLGRLTAPGAGHATDRVHVANDGGRPLTLLVAPAALEHVLAPGAAAVVEAEGPAGAGAGLLVERTCDTAVVWTWPGATARILASDGRVLADGSDATR